MYAPAGPGGAAIGIANSKMTFCWIVIARSEATKQSSSRLPIFWIARGACHRPGHFGPDPLARNDEIRPVLVRQRVGTHLNVNRDRRHALAAFLEPRRPVALRRPQTSAFPAGLRIVDACIESLGIEAERVGDPQQYHLAVDQGGEAVILIGGRDRHVAAEADRVMLIDPGVVARLGAVVANALESRSRIFVEAPSLRAVIAGRGRSVQRSFAFCAIEAADMATGERNPEHAF